MSDLVVQESSGIVPEAPGITPVTPAATLVEHSEPEAPVVTRRPRTRPRRSAEDEAAWRTIVEEWHRLVGEASASRGPLPTVRGFCEQRQLREPSFYWWRREFAIRDGKPLPTMRSPDSTRIGSHLGFHPSPAPKAAFVQLRVKPTTHPVSSLSLALCELVVGNVVVRVSPGFDAAELARLLDVLTTAR